MDQAQWGFLDGLCRAGRIPAHAMSSTTYSKDSNVHLPRVGSRVSKFTLVHRSNAPFHDRPSPLLEYLRSAGKVENQMI